MKFLRFIRKRRLNAIDCACLIVTDVVFRDAAWWQAMLFLIFSLVVLNGLADAVSELLERKHDHV